MPVVAVVGAFAGSAVAGALGVSAAVGATLGGGLLSGIYAESQGGSFGKGFAMGAIGGAIGGAFGSALGGFGEVAAQGLGEGFVAAPVAGSELFGGFATDAAALSGAAGEIGGLPAGTGGLEGISSGAETMAPTGMSEIATPTQPQSLADYASEFGGTIGDGTTNAVGANYDYGFVGQEAPQAVSGNVGASPDIANTQQSYNPYDTSLDTSMSGGLEQITGQSPTGSGVEGVTPTVDPAQQPQQGGLKGLFNSTDNWLSENLGIKSSPGNPGSPTMKIGSALLQGYQSSQRADQLQDQTNQMRQQYASVLNPMSLEQYMSANYKPQDAQRASMRMARAGRTGTIPAMQTLMKQQAAQGYTNNYLPQAQRAGLGASMQLANREAQAAAAKEQSWGAPLSLAGLYAR